MPKFLLQIQSFSSTPPAEHVSDVPDYFQRLQDALNKPFWHHIDFWINAILGAAGLWFAIWAYIEARGAKKAAKDAETAATEAGQFMTMQTVAIELMAISQRLNGLDVGNTYKEVRSFLDEITGKLHRLTSPFQDNDALNPHITNINTALGSFRTELSNVRPAPGATPASGQIYYAIEGEAAILNTYVNDLLGQLETKSHQKLAT